jgi:hypothetical protein
LFVVFEAAGLLNHLGITHRRDHAGEALKPTRSRNPYFTPRHDAMAPTNMPGSGTRYHVRHSSSRAVARVVNNREWEFLLAASGATALPQKLNSTLPTYQACNKACNKAT